MKFILQITPFDQVNGKLDTYGQNLSFTIFDSEVAYYNASVITAAYLGIYQDDKSKTIADLVSFKPNRIIEHEIIIALTFTVRLKDLSDDLSYKFNLIKNKINAQDLSDVCGRSNDYLRETVRAKVNAIIDFYLEAGILESLPVYHLNKRFTFTINGATAVGKSSSEDFLKENIKNVHNVTWDLIAKINGDSYKYILEASGFKKSKLFLQLIQPEINLLYKLINQRLTEIIAAGSAPHVFIDKVFMYNDNINLALFGGAKLDGILVDAPIEQALLRAEDRGIKTGRYEDVYNIFYNHASIAKKYADFLSVYKGKAISYALFDNSNNLTKTAEVDLADKMISIYDNDKFLKFLGKAKLNVSESLVYQQIIYDQNNLQDELHQQIITDYRVVDYCLSDFDF